MCARRSCFNALYRLCRRVCQMPLSMAEWMLPGVEGFKLLAGGAFTAPICGKSTIPALDCWSLNGTKKTACAITIIVT